MGYALFAQRKLVLTSQLSCAQLQQTQRSNEQFMLATSHASLSRQLASMEASYAKEKADLYRQLSQIAPQAQPAGQTQNPAQTPPANQTGGDNQTAQQPQPQTQAQTQAQNDVQNQKDIINAKIKEIEEKSKANAEQINNQIYVVSIKENAIELEVKRLDTMVTALQEQLEAVQQAEGRGIQNSIPKFSGLG